MTSIKNIHRLEPRPAAGAIAGGIAGTTADTLAPTSLVVLFHGYGADGADLLDLGRQWQAALPETLFLAPDAPTACEMNSAGCQWWSLRAAMEAGFSAAGLNLALRETGAEELREPMLAWLDAERTKLNLPWSRVALVGFSQGTMLALHLGLRLPEAPAAIVGFSGALLAPQSLTAPGLVRPPILLVHGMMDMVVPFAAMNIAEAQLRGAGLKVISMARPQLGHGIDGQGIAEAGRFIAGAFAL